MKLKNHLTKSFMCSGIHPQPKATHVICKDIEYNIAQGQAQGVVFGA